MTALNFQPVAGFMMSGISPFLIVVVILRVVINNLYFMSPIVFLYKTNAVLIVNPDTVLPLAII